MRKFIKIFIVLSLFVLGCSQSVKVGISNDTIDDLQRLPDEATSYFFCDFSKVSNSELAQEFFPFFNEELQREFTSREFERFKEMTDFNPDKDFKSILLAVNREKRFDEKPHVIIHGKFNEDKIIDFLEEKADDEGEEIPWRKENIEGHSVYLVEESNEHVGFCFLDSKTLYFGDLVWITSVLKDEFEGISSKNLNQLKNSIQFGKHFWFSILPTSNSDKPWQNMMKNVLPLTGSISKLTMSAHVDEGIKFQGDVHCDSPETSKLMVDMMKGALAAAKLHVYKDRDAVDAINRIKVKGNDNRVFIHGNLNKEFFDKLDEYSMLPWRKYRKRTG